uniref:Uncharacterized protein n=1 Tax=Populus trichocarpa TaxID=3694 RepID=A0A2K2B183_POPTR
MNISATTSTNTNIINLNIQIIFNTMTLHFNIIRNFFFITILSSCCTGNSTKKIKVWMFFSLSYLIIIR